MFSALYRKELKAISLWIPALLLINFFLLYKLENLFYLSEPITTYAFKQEFFGVNILIALIIGFVHTAIEHIRNTHQFLVFRPVSPSKILCAKILAGLTVISVSLLIIFFRLHYLLTHPEILVSPWRWSMFGQFFVAYMIICLFYLAGLMIGADTRNRWFGLKTVAFFYCINVTANILELACSLNTAYMMCFFFGIFLLIRLFQIYCGIKCNAILSQIPFIILLLGALTFFLPVIAYWLFNEKFQTNYILLDYKNNIITASQKSYREIDYIDENNEFVKNFSWKKILNHIIITDPYYPGCPPLKENLDHNASTYFSNSILIQNKRNTILWYYIFEDRIFEIYTVNMFKENIRESKFIGYFGKNGFSPKKDKIQPLNGKHHRSSDIYIEKNYDNTNTGDSNFYYIMTGEAAYKIFPDSFSISLINDFSEIKSSNVQYLDNKIFDGDKYKFSLPAYILFSKKNSKLIKAVNIFDKTKNTEIEIPCDSDNLSEVRIYLAANDTFFITLLQNDGDGKNKYSIYKKELNKKSILIKKIEKENIFFWQSKISNYLRSQPGLRILNYFIFRLSNEIRKNDSLLHRQFGILSKVYITGSIIGFFIFIILYFFDMRKLNMLFSRKILWLGIAIFYPYFFPFVYFCVERK